MPPINIRTRQTIDFIDINEDVDMQGNRATNAGDAEQPKDLVTKEQLGEEVEQATNWGTKDW